PGDGLGLDLESGPDLRIGERTTDDHLECDDAVEPGLMGFVHHAHAAASQLTENLVSGDHREDIGVGASGIRQRVGQRQRARDRIGRWDAEEGSYTRRIRGDGVPGGIHCAPLALTEKVRGSIEHSHAEWIYTEGTDWLDAHPARNRTCPVFG